jgi:hypothetical protein
MNAETDADHADTALVVNGVFHLRMSALFQRYLRSRLLTACAMD